MGVHDGEAISILGAAPDTSNLGVGALLASTLAAIESFGGEIPVGVFDNGFGIRQGEVDVGGSGRQVTLIGARASKRLHRSDTMARIAFSGQIGLRSNPAVSALRASGAVLDVSAGDSFSDIYGWSRYSNVLLQKQVCLRVGVPLLLMPQTYGPYRSKAAVRLARSVLRRADFVMARDRNSHDYLRELLGVDFDRDRHRLGVDLAFGLPAVKPELGDDVEGFFDANESVIGLNVSGLLFNDPESAGRFGLADDYRKTVRTTVETLLGNTDAGVLLVPHVIPPEGRIESDVAACRGVAELFVEWGPRLRVAEAPRTASEAKGLIGRTDWFAGSRMHSTIAALSSGVPAAAMAYSGKAHGVFESAGLGADVVDMRVHDAHEIAERLLDSYGARAQARATLESTIVDLRFRARQQVVEALQEVGFTSKDGRGQR